MRVTVPLKLRKSLAALASEYECDVQSVVEVAVEEMLAAHRSHPAPSPKKRAAPQPEPTPQKAGRVYAARPCSECGASFVPSGPRAAYCETHRGRRRPAHGDEDGEFDVVWNGAMGRQGVSLTGQSEAH